MVRACGVRVCLWSRQNARHHDTTVFNSLVTRPSVRLSSLPTIQPGHGKRRHKPETFRENYRARRETVNGFISDQARDATLAPYTLWPCACLSQVGVLSKWMNGSSWLLAETLHLIYPASSYYKQPAFRALTLLAGRQEEHPACKN